MVNLVAFFSGIVFALGLGISGMTLPTKVIGFLDVFGNWDPSLLFVMVGAISVFFFAQKLILRRQRPLLQPKFHFTPNRTIDWRLCLGATLFGIGWGLAGFCPGPALTSLATLHPGVILFVAAMLLGMWANRFVPKS